jgi:hypothetical protein
MHEHLDNLTWAGIAPAVDNQLLMIRATLAGIPLSATGTPRSLTDAAQALDGVCMAMERIVAQTVALDSDQLVQGLCNAVNAGILQSRTELERQLLDPHRALVRARLTLLRSLVILTEVRHIVAQRRGEAQVPHDAIDVARAVILVAVRANPTNHDWIGSVADAEIALLATVPRERMGADFLHRLFALRALVAECANYESRRTSRTRPLLASS